MSIPLSKQRRSLLSSQARIQAPWIKVTIGTYTFGVFSKKGIGTDKNGFYQSYEVDYPNFVTSLNITKLNGKVNQYTLNISYPVKSTDDPNFFEKVFSSVSDTRKIVFSYGDSATPSYVYKDEEALITDISNTFNIQSSVINYTIKAVSSATLGMSGSYSFPATGSLVKPSSIIKNLFYNPNYGLADIFKGMSKQNIDELIAGDDAAVKIDTKLNISILDYITYLVSCMVPSGTTNASNISPDIYILTIHDDTIYDRAYNDNVSLGGSYFKVTRTSYKSEQSDAYEIDIGYNTATLVTSFSVDHSENYSLFYDYQSKLHPAKYVQRIDENGEWTQVYAPANTSKGKFDTDPEDVTWWTKITKYPINANITIQGLLRPAMLMQYVRLNVIFPGGHKHIASGLYIITKQMDTIDSSGYRTQLSLTKISGDSSLEIN